MPAAPAPPSGRSQARYPAFLGYTLLALLGGLPLGCLAGGLLLALWQLLVAGDPGSAGQGLSIALVALPLGLLPAVLYGAPVYALLAWRGWARVPVVAAAGALPGLLVLPWLDDLAAFVALFGFTVALCTHAIAARRLRRLHASPSAARAADSA